MSESDQRILRKLIRYMVEGSEMLTEPPETDTFSMLKKDFDRRVKNLNTGADKIGRQMANMFLFSESVFGEGQELLVIATELTADRDSAAFIGKFGCKKYYRHNEELLPYERQGEIVRALKNLDSS